MAFGAGTGSSGNTCQFSIPFRRPHSASSLKRGLRLERFGSADMAGRIPNVSRLMSHTAAQPAV